MKTLFKNTVLLLSVFILSCSNDDNLQTLNQLKSRVLLLESVSDPAISGSVEFTENTNGSITVEVELINTIPGEMHPVYIYNDHSLASGTIAATLTPVNGDTGKSATTITALDDGSSLSYSQLLNFDGHLKIHESSNNLPVLIAQADIGQNELSGLSKTYTLVEKAMSNITGTVDFFERRNGEILTTFTIEGSTTGETYAAQLRMNDAQTTGAEVFSFNSITGLDNETVITKTNLSNLNGQTNAFTYDDLLVYNGYVNIDAIATLNTVAQVNIGANEAVNIPQTFTYDVTNNMNMAYVYNGNGLVDANNSNFTFVRGNTYIFNLNVPGQPIYIKTVQGNGVADAYTNGVTGNGNTTGTLQIVVPNDAPNTLYINSEFVAEMTSVINVTN